MAVFGNFFPRPLYFSDTFAIPLQRRIDKKWLEVGEFSVCDVMDFLTPKMRINTFISVQKFVVLGPITKPTYLRNYITLLDGVVWCASRVKKANATNLVMGRSRSIFEKNENVCWSETKN